MNASNAPVPEEGNLIDGTWKPARSGKTIGVESPSDGTAFAAIPDSGPEDMDDAVLAARSAFETGSWSKLTPTERGRLLTRLAELTERNAEELSCLEARDTGKPLKQARNDLAATCRYFEYYGGAADKLHGETIPFLGGYDVRSVREPFGVTAHVIPWNYPAQMFGRSLSPALAVGNAVVLKPAEDACLVPLRLAELAMEAGFPAGSLNVVTGRGSTAGATLAGHAGIDFVSFTGSPEVGASIQAAAGANHVDCTLELGGKSPQVIFADADLEAALPVVVNAIVQNGGQTCSAGSRALIEAPIFDRVIEGLSDRFKNLVAAPHFEDRDLGALISARQLARVQEFLDHANESSSLLAAGTISDTAPSSGHFVAPSLYGPVDPTLPLAQEEVFGPVLSCIPFRTEEEAVQIANSTPYGLVAGIWTRDGGRQARMARAFRCGQVFINCFGAGGGIELPFGGVGRSGHGREKGFEALREFSYLKTVVHRFE